MRIISGSLKGKSIKFLKNSNTRPLKDIIKENIFNILTHSNSVNIKIKNSNVLDLYSGVGSFGVECISRGASKVTFIEKDNIAFNVLKTNIIELSISEKTEIFNERIENVLKRNINEKFEIIFFDPPFSDDYFQENLELIKGNKLFAVNHIVIIHREKKTNDMLDRYIKIIETKQYGRSKIIFGFIN